MIMMATRARKVSRNPIEIRDRFFQGILLAFSKTKGHKLFGINIKDVTFLYNIQKFIFV